LRFNRVDVKESFEVKAQPQGGEGHYVAEIKFPSAGQWNWHVDIEQFGMITQPMPVLSVQAAQAIAPAKATPAKTLQRPLALILDIVEAIDRMLTGKADDATISAQTMPLRLVAAKAAPVDQAALGKALFSAKGCVMCHSHAEVNKGQPVFWFGDTPTPDLTVNKFSTDYLRSWLTDPTAIKPNTPMPDLNLQPDEIDALITFLQTAR
jgi:cytochrome c2